LDDFVKDPRHLARPCESEALIQLRPDNAENCLVFLV